MGKVWEIDNDTFPIVWVLFSRPIPILWYTSAYGKCMVFPINFPQYRKMQHNPWYGESLGNRYSHFSHSMVAFFPSDSHPMVYFSTWEMYGFPHKFPTVWENATKPTVWRKSGKLIIILKPIVWVLFYHLIPILWYTSAYGKCIGFPINFPQCGKMQQNPWYGESLGNRYSYFSHTMGTFFPYDSHPTVYVIIWEMHGFSHQFPIVQENATKLIIWGEPGKLVLIFFPYYGRFLSIRFPIVYFITWEMHVFSH